MKTTLYLLKQNLKFYRRRYFLFIISILFAVLIIISISCFKDTYNWFQQERLYYEYGTYDLTTQQSLEPLSDHALVDTSVQVSIEKLEDQTQIIYVTAFNDLLPLHLVEGSYPNKESEIAISYHDYRVNGEFELGQQVIFNEKTYTLIGIIDDGRSNPYGFDQSYYKLGKTEGPFYNYLKLNNYSLKEMKDIQEELEALTSERIHINTPVSYAMQGLNSGSSLFDLSILCILAGIVLTVFFWIKNMYLLSFNEHKKNYQIYHALGLNQKQLRRLVLGEAGVLGVTGCLCGIAVSYLVLSIIFKLSGRHLFGYMAEKLAVYPMIKPSLLLLAVLAVMVPLLWIAYHFVRITDHKVKRKKYKYYRNKTSAVKMLSGIYYHNEKMKIFGIQLSIFVSLLILFISQFSLTSMLTHQYDKMTHMPAIHLQVYSLADESIIPYTDFLKTIDDLMALGLDKGSYEISAGNQFFAVRDKDVLIDMNSYDKNAMAEINADNLKLYEAVLLVKDKAEADQWLDNDTLTISYDDPLAEQIELSIKDVHECQSNPVLIVSSQTIKEVNNLLAATGSLNMAKNVLIEFESEDSYQLEKILTELLDSTGFDYNLLNKVKSLEEDEIQANALSYFSSLILGTILITTLISFISTLMLQIENRKNDYKIYRALGMNTEQLKAMLRKEIIRSLFPAYFIAVAASFILCFILSEFVFEVVEPFKSYPYSLILGMGICLVLVSWYLIEHAKNAIHKNLA